MLLDEELWVGERLGVDYSLIMCNCSFYCPQHCTYKGGHGLLLEPSLALFSEVLDLSRSLLPI